MPRIDWPIRIESVEGRVSIRRKGDGAEWGEPPNDHDVDTPSRSAPTGSSAGGCTTRFKCHSVLEVRRRAKEKTTPDGHTTSSLLCG